MKKHLWLMILCCLIPIAAIVAVRVMGIQLGTWSTALFLILCPLSHIVLMWAMRHDDQKNENPHQAGTVLVRADAEIPGQVENKS